MERIERKICLALAILLMMSALLVSCEDGSDPTAHGHSNDYMYSFSYNSVSITPGSSFEQLKPQLGEPTGYFEAASCAFDGNDKIYTYGSVQISVSPLAGVDTVYMVTLLDDSIATPEGISVGDAKTAVIEAYGDKGVDNGASMVYIAGLTELVFLIRDDCVTSVQYRYLDAASVD